MSNDHYLIVSYFAGFALSLALAVFTYRLLRQPFGRIADAALKHCHSTFLKRALPVILTLGATVSFLGVNYTDNSCHYYTYKDIVKERSYMHQKNREQLAAASTTTAQIVVMFSVAVLICLVVMKRNGGQKD